MYHKCELNEFSQTEQTYVIRLQISKQTISSSPETLSYPLQSLLTGLTLLLITTTLTSNS